MAIGIWLIQGVFFYLVLDFVSAQWECLQPGCSAPFPPGHIGIGDAWWAIGAEHFGARIEAFTTSLTVPEAIHTNRSLGSPVMNCALENTVC